MIRVRFPNGQCVTYNSAYYVEHFDNYHKIRTKSGGDVIAIAPKDSLIELVEPCRVENPIERNVLARATDYVESLSGRTPGMDDQYLARLKRKLAGYDIRRLRFVR